MPVLMQHGAQGYGAFPKFSKNIVRMICFLGISHITSSLTQQGFHRQMTHTSLLFSLQSSESNNATGDDLPKMSESECHSVCELDDLRPKHDNTAIAIANVGLSQSNLSAQMAERSVRTDSPSGAGMR
jgi:hypothetical protein